MQLRDQLQQALGSAYTLERELGGGGMSRVFVARDESLRRLVVVKVLPPELLAGVNADRFNREIELAAGLQHPHIVPVHAAGQVDGMPFYTMPYVDGESLRIRLSSPPALTVAEVIGVMRDIAKALAYAHAHGVVHRDIKPDNVLLSGGSATVTDFGIAKALAAAKVGNQRLEGVEGDDNPSLAALTALGTSIGTPAYMAPEQAAGDPNTGHRADIYAFGCTAYEMLAGRPPFHGMPPQRLFAAHQAERPRPIAGLRPDVPLSVGALIMQCLEKDPNARPDGAEIVRVLDMVGTTLEGAYASPWRALVVYVAAFAAVVLAAQAAIAMIGLPHWVLPGAAAVMALGLPVLLFTAYVHQQSTGVALRVRPHVSWRRAALGGSGALGMFVFLVAGYMILRALGIGPAGSLLAAGVVHDHDVVLVADFASPADSTLGRAITEAVRTDLGQSNVVTLAPGSIIAQTLALMQKPPATHIDTSVARVIAERAGLKAVLGGDVAKIGGSYVLTAQLISPSSGDVLASFRETASGERDLLPAIDRLTRALRTKIGESIRRVQSEPALSAVTTTSLDALRKYAQAIQVGDVQGDLPAGMALMNDAVRLDSTFAMAWRKLGVWSSNLGRPDAIRYMTKAFENREHLTELERYSIEGAYYSEIGDAFDSDKAIAAYRRAIAIDSTDAAPNINFALLLLDRGNTAAADTVYRRLARIDDPFGLYEYPLALAQEGNFRAADSVVAVAVAKAPAFPYRWSFDFFENASRGRYDSAAADAKHVRFELRGGMLGALLMTQGQLERARRVFGMAIDSVAAAGDSASALKLAAEESWIDSWYGERPAAASTTLEAAERRFPIEEQPKIERPYFELASAYAVADRLDRATSLVAAGDRELSPGIRRGHEEVETIAKGLIAMGEKRPRDAIALLARIPAARCGAMSARAAGVRGSVPCTEPFLAAAYDQLGEADSALAAFERYVTSTGVQRFGTDATQLGRSLERLGELYEQKGDKQRAAHYYGQFVALWAKADATLQPQVADVRKRLARIGDLEAR